jgi:hypothetical protein
MIRQLVIALVLHAIAGASVAVAAEEPKGPPPPKAHEYSYSWDLIDNSLVRPVTRVFDAPIVLRRLTHQPREADNVDANDQVRLPSTWWQPRIGFRTVTVERMLSGPGPMKGPVAPWKITSAKTQGVTPGFQIKDAKGDRFLIKCDPPNSAELATSADVVGSYLFWAAGYNVPENTIAYFRAESLQIDPKATYTNASGKKVPFTSAYLAELLKRIYRQKDGRYRVLASRFLSGKPLGPFKYNGRRHDDPEDLIPHEHRRELRGLWTIAAWINHADSRGPNSLDMWVTENGRSFVRHHLLDFGSILGSSAVGPHDPATGTEYYVDAHVMLDEALSIGLKPFAWESAKDPAISSVGFVDAETFDPVHWRTDFPNPAYDERTVRDIRWGAHIVAGFTDEHIRAALKAARYSNPRAEDYLARVLIARRDKIVRAWLTPEGPQGTLPPP